MSSHYIDLICPAPDCTRSEGIYTGSVLTDYFEAALDYEGATIDARCDEHSNWVDAPTPDPALHACHIDESAGMDPAVPGNAPEVTAAIERGAERMAGTYLLPKPSDAELIHKTRVTLDSALDVEEMAAGACRAIHSSRWDFVSITEPCDECWATAGAWRKTILGGAS